MTALMTDLKRLSSMRAPDGFAERVLIEVGMADSYARFGTVLGNVYVAWNRFGVSAAARSASAAEFEDWFGQDVGRPLVAAEPPAEPERPEPAPVVTRPGPPRIEPAPVPTPEPPRIAAAPPVRPVPGG